MFFFLFQFIYFCNFVNDGVHIFLLRRQLYNFIKYTELLKFVLLVLGLLFAVWSDMFSF